jgi:hypothetical protein
MFTETLQIGIIARDLEGAAPDPEFVAEIAEPAPDLEFVAEIAEPAPDLEFVAEIAEPAPGADLNPRPDAVYPPAR